MAEPVIISDSELAQNAADDIDMQVGLDTGDGTLEAINTGEDDGLDLPDIPDLAATRTPFLEYLKSPIIELAVGTGGSSTVITAHEDLLTQSSFFAEACTAFVADGPRRIFLPDEDLEAMGSFIEYLYRGDYFPRSIGNALETHPSIPDIDNDGTYLLKHARVYTLAEKFSVPSLKSLAHTKIHHTTSTARGEIAYARYVYATTSPDDKTIRRPVAAFWGTRSHVLRHEAEEEFRAMCLEFPQFGFDVLSMVLDQKEKRTGGGRDSIPASAAGISVGVETPGTGRGKKRQRNA